METTTEVTKTIIKPVTTPKFAGLSAYRKTTTVLTTEMDGNTGFYKTGLSLDEEKEYEKALQLAEGTLKKTNAKFWSEITIALKNDGPTFIFHNGPMDDLKVRILEQSSKVANNEAQLKDKPTALFVIHDEEKLASAEEEKLDNKANAYEALLSMNSEEKRNLLKVILFESRGARKGVDNMSDKLVKNYLSKELENDPIRFNMLSKDKTLQIKVLIADAVEKGIVQKTANNVYKWGDEIVAHTNEDMIAYLMKEQTAKLSIESQLKRKRENK